MWILNVIKSKLIKCGKFMCCSFLFIEIVPIFFFQISYFPFDQRNPREPDEEAARYLIKSVPRMLP